MDAHTDDTNRSKFEYKTLRFIPNEPDTIAGKVEAMRLRGWEHVSTIAVQSGATVELTFQRAVKS